MFTNLSNHGAPPCENAGIFKISNLANQSTKGGTSKCLVACCAKKKVQRRGARSARWVRLVGSTWFSSFVHMVLGGSSHVVSGL